MLFNNDVSVAKLRTPIIAPIILTKEPFKMKIKTNRDIQARCKEAYKREKETCINETIFPEEIQ